MWLVCYIPRWFTCSQTITHPSRNQAWPRATVLIATSMLTTTPSCRPGPVHVCVYACVSRSGLPVQAYNAEQAASGAGRLRGRELGTSTEDVLTQVGVHLHAGRGTGQVSYIACLSVCLSVTHTVLCSVAGSLVYWLAL